MERRWVCLLETEGGKHFEREVGGGVFLPQIHCSRDSSSSTKFFFFFFFARQPDSARLKSDSSALLSSSRNGVDLCLFDQSAPVLQLRWRQEAAAEGCPLKASEEVEEETPSQDDTEAALSSESFARFHVKSGVKDGPEDFYCSDWWFI